MRPIAILLSCGVFLSCASGSRERTAGAGAAPSQLTAEQRAREAALLPLATATLDAWVNSSAALTRSGKFAYLSSRDGLPQLYLAEAARPGDPPRRLPSPAERVISPALTADEKTVLFRSDVGADLQFHIFKVGLDGSGLADLSQGMEKLTRGPPLPVRERPDLFAYSAHATVDERTRVFLQSTDGSPPREIHSDARRGSLLDVAPDGSRILFSRFNSTDDIVVFEVVVGGRSRRVYPPEGSAVRCGAAYSARADRILVWAHAEGSHSELRALDPEGRTVARYQETKLPQGSIAAVAVSPAGDRLAIAVDAGNHSEVRLLEAATLRLERTLEAPLGAVFPGRFTADGARLTLEVSRAESPGEVFAADPATGEVVPLRDEARPGSGSLPPLRVSIESVPAFDGLALPVNLYLPARREGKLPTIVLIHGGPSSSAYVRWNPEVRFFSALGYAVVEPNIRGSTGFGVAFQKADDKEKRADALKDVETINRWARAQDFCDPDKLIIMGTSYGGYMTLLALTRQPRLWRAGVELSGMSDLRTMEKLEDQTVRAYDETEFGKLGVDDAVLLEWSPLKDADNIVAPLFVYQGARDVITPQNEADQIVAALRRRGVPVEYMLIANEGHGIVRRENRAAFFARAGRFLQEH